MIIIGVDPGLNGGICLLGSGYVPLFRMPTLPSGKGSGKVLDENQIMVWFKRTLGKGESSHAFIEKATAMPKQGVVSMFTFGCGFGIIRGILVGLGIPYTLVTPQEWRKELLKGMPKGKGSSLIVANRLFPKAVIGKHDGMAEALLIAEYGRRTLE